MSSFKTLLGGRPHIIKITIPDNTALPVSFYTILKNAGIVAPIYAEISGLLADGSTTRPAIEIATPRPGIATIASGDFSTHHIIKGAGELYTTPPTTNFDYLYIRSNSSSTIDAQLLVLEGI